MDIIYTKLIELLVAGLLFGLLFIVKKKNQGFVAWALTAYLIALGVGFI